MTRWYGIAALMMGLSLGACGSSKPKPAAGPVEPAFTPAPDEQALVGTWSDGAVTFAFNGRAYTWTEVIPCGAPTCEQRQKAAGEYQLRSGKVMLKGALGDNGDLLVGFGFQNNQQTLTLDDNGKSWTLNRR
jgi:hypothetical protein